MSAEINQLFEAAFAATNAGDFVRAESLWSQLLEYQPDNPALWSNRGNARVSQHKFQEALSDYAEAIRLAPNAPDPYLNRGAALEGLGRWQEAIADYERVLELNPNDPAAYNNRGNAEAGLGNWQQAPADYRHATELDPNYVLAQANYALSLYQVGETQSALRLMRALVRKYPKFPDVRAALSVILWAEGHPGEAESHWVAVQGLDPRYADLECKNCSPLAACCCRCSGALPDAQLRLPSRLCSGFQAVCALLLSCALAKRRVGIPVARGSGCILSASLGIA